MPRRNTTSPTRSLEIALRVVRHHVEALELHDIPHAVAGGGPWEADAKRLRRECAEARRLIASDPKMAFFAIGRLHYEVTMMLVKVAALPKDCADQMMSGVSAAQLN